MTELKIPFNVKNAGLISWVQEMVELCKPANVYWCDGSQEEYDRLCEEMVAAGTLSGSTRPSAPILSSLARTRLMSHG